LDGWWDEGFHPDFGWAIGHGEVYEEHHFQDETESRDLYNILESEAVPLFYQRASDDVPRGWVDKMRAGLRTLVPRFNAHRMLQEYLNLYYLPCSRRYNALCADDFAGTKELAAWRQKLMTSWHEIAVQGVISKDGPELTMGQEVEVEAEVRLGSLSPEDVSVEVYYGRLDRMGDFIDRETASMEVKSSADGLFTFVGAIPCNETGRFGYTVRILPSQKRLENRFIMGLVAWA
jgi:starch phosphorylase